MKRNLFTFLLWNTMAAISIYVTLSTPVIKCFFEVFHDEEEIRMIIAAILMFESLFVRAIANDLANLIFGKNFRKDNESKYQTRLPDDVNESVLAKGTSEAGISTPVELHEVVFKKALFNYYNTKYLGPYNYSSGEECVKDAVLDAAKGRHLKNEEINSVTNEIMGYLDHSALTHSNPPLFEEWLDYTYSCLEKIEINGLWDYDFQSLVTRKLRREGRNNKDCNK